MMMSRNIQLVQCDCSMQSSSFLRSKLRVLHVPYLTPSNVSICGRKSVRRLHTLIANSATPAKVLAVATLDRESVRVESVDRESVRVESVVPQDSGSFVEEFDEAYDEQDYHNPDDVVQVNANEVDDSLRVENLGLCPETVGALKKRGIEALFPIQKHVLQPIMDGRDLIGRAKTGSGKTLAFALPVIEDLIRENKTVRPAMGRSPRCVILAPTRELANQVAREFESACPTLKVKSVYGGVPIGSQMSALERGVDVVVGTPGRVIDLIERRKLGLDKVRFSILDEADQMLDMGFEEDMERILSGMPEQRQTLLFSATLPKWVSKVAKRFQQNPVLVDLVGEENTGKLADTIRCLVYPVAGSKMSAVLEVLSVYAAGGKAIVFCNTKKAADEVCAVISATNSCEALHGDIGQSQREQTLQRFRDGRVNVMVATDVAARGLDIPSVDLVVHFDLPQDSEAFLHRSGRTGRAGNKGTTIVMQSPSEGRTLGQLLMATKTTEAEMVGAPNPADVMRAASRTVLTKLDQVDPGVIDFFQPAADKLLASGQPERVLAAALAAISGFKLVPRSHSLLTGLEGFTSLKCTCSQPGVLDGVNSLLRVLKPLLRFTKSPIGLDKSVIGKLQVYEDANTSSYGLVFDISDEVAAELLAAFHESGIEDFFLEAPRSLPIDAKMLMHKSSVPRADRGRNDWGGRRGSSSRGSWGGSRSSGGSRSRGNDGGYGGGSYGGGRSSGKSYGGNRDSYGGRDSYGSKSSYGNKSGGRQERGDWGSW